MTALVLKILLAYMLGSVAGALVVGRFRGVDIRESGSHNPGGTNAFRTQGIWFALPVVLIDVGKGVIAAGLVPLIQFPGLEESVAAGIQVLACALAAVFGHCYPVWHGFRGGKGAGTAVGTLTVIQPMTLIPLIATWLIMLGLTGWVGLATMLAGLSLIPAMLWLDAPREQFWFAVVLALFLVFTHRSNVRDMLQGKEYRFQKAMIRNWFKPGR